MSFISFTPVRHLFIYGADTRSQHTDLSGGDSPLTAGSPENSGVAERRFADEPLYQFYTAAVVEVFLHLKNL